VAVAFAAGRLTTGVILDARFTSTVDVVAAAYPFVPVRWLMKDTWHSDERIERVTATVRLWLQIKSALDRANIVADDNLGRTIARRWGVFSVFIFQDPPQIRI
jgi:hypothetical protein